MNGKHAKVLQAVFRAPTPANIDWSDLEGLLKAGGCEVIEGPGSAVSFRKDDMIEFFHRPHPEKEAKQYQVRAAKAFLIRLGIQP